MSNVELDAPNPSKVALVSGGTMVAVATPAPEKPPVEDKHPHHHRHAAYAAEATGLLMMAVLLLILIVIRYWSNIPWSAR